MKYCDIFHPECFYHVFNHAVGSENLFKSHDNFMFFLAKFNKYMSPICKVYCYCLMPNHFHFFIQIKHREVIMKLAKIDSDENFNYHKFLMQQLSNFLNSYAKAFNKQQKRMGALFLDFTKRIEIKDDFSFNALIRYIHQNPVNHGFCKLPSDWNYSSYNAIISPDISIIEIEKNTVLNWFEGVDNFIDFHLAL
jgi:putative transposase